MTVATIEAAPLPERMEYAKALAGSSLIPRAFQQRPADVLVAIEYGNALGIAPIVALSEINVINGSPSLSASLMAALARQAGHKVRVTGDDRSATCTIVRADDPDFSHTATWDEAKAKSAGLWNKGHWAKDAGTMLRWRAISECVRFACSEVLGGIRYTPEEVHEMQPERVTVQQVPVAKVEPPKAQSLTEAVAQHQEQEAVWEKPGDPIDFGESPVVELRTPAQSTKLAVLIRENNLQRDEALAYFTSVVGREISTTKELTKAEASKVIDALQSARDDGADPVTGEVVDAELIEPEGWDK